MASILSMLRSFAARLSRDQSGAVAQILALAVLPLVFAAGAAVDYSRASSERAKLQAALDAAVIAGAKDGTANWTSTAANVFTARFGSADGASTTFSVSNGVYTGTASASAPTAFVGIAGFKHIPIGATAAAAAGDGADGSCILTLGHNQSVADQSMTFNGAPKVALSGCTIRSNTSLTCNGHSTGAKASIAAGTVSGSCSNAQPNASVVPDIYKPLAINITKQCSSRPGAIWIPGVVPPSPMVITVNKGSYTEYHVCGDLTLSGSGALTGAAPASDAVIIIENGKLIMGNSASIQANRVTFVLTGDNSRASFIDFPNGNGHAATLSLSPSTSSGNPWHGVSIYQDPSLTNTVDEDWGPGATLNMDGIVYLPNADVKIHGNPSSNSPLCAKLVVNTLVSDGAVNLNRTAQGCSNLGVQEWTGKALRLVN